MQELMELKYCERCGNLGLRRNGSRHTYCAGCEQEMARTYLAPSASRGNEVATEEVGGEKKKPSGSVKVVRQVEAAAAWSGGGAQ